MDTVGGGLDWLNSVVSFKEFFVNGNSPSQKSGLSLSEEFEFRFMGAHLVQRAGRLLKMPQSGIMTGQILLQEFYCQNSLFSFPLLDVAMGCTLVASKVEECQRRVRDAVNVFYWLYQELKQQQQRQRQREQQQQRQLAKIIMEYVSEEYYEWRDRVTRIEMEILRVLGFHVQPRHPVGLLANYLKALEISDDPRVGQRAINYINDSLRTVTYVCIQPHVIACAAITMAAEYYKVKLPEDPSWYQVFDVTLEDLIECQNLIALTYEIHLNLDLPLVAAELAKFSKTCPPSLTRSNTADFSILSKEETNYDPIIPPLPFTRSPSGERGKREVSLECRSKYPACSRIDSHPHPSYPHAPPIHSHSPTRSRSRKVDHYKTQSPPPDQTRKSFHSDRSRFRNRSRSRSLEGRKEKRYHYDDDHHHHYHRYR